MFSIKTKMLLMLATLLLCVTGAGAQEPQQNKSSAGDNFVTEKGFRSRVFEIKYRDPSNLMRVLTPLGSGFKGAVVSFNQELKTITMRDFPENIATVEEALKRLDVPDVPRPGIEFHVHILVATNNTLSPFTPYPAELENVIKQLQSTLSYKHYGLMTSQIMRAKEQGFNRVSNKGVAELKLPVGNPAGTNPIFYDFSLQNISLDSSPSSGGQKIAIGEFAFSMKIPLMINQGSLQYENIGFNTPVNLREGEKVVVGTTSMEDKGIIVVLTASVTK
ncbi:MAG: secretin N-terminal domain-containing protein [Pyrinomonadaceae bacterium]